MVLLGLFAVPASLVWTLFWFLVGVWEWPFFGDELGSWLYFGALLAVGVVSFFVGVFLLVGRFPGRVGWLVVTALALVPCALVIRHGQQTNDRIAAVNRMSVQAYAAQRGDLETMSATCAWEGDEGEYESWRCRMGEGDDSCSVNVRERARIGLVVNIEGCVFDRGQGEVDVDTREVSRALIPVYERRTGRRAAGARCTEDDQNEGEAICGLRLSDDPDRCFVTFGPHRGGVSVRILYCEQDLQARVDAAAERMYEKRTSSDDVSAECTLEEDDQWTCVIALPGGRDRCTVGIIRRNEGPRIEFWRTSCASGRI